MKDKLNELLKDKKKLIIIGIIVLILVIGIVMLFVIGKDKEIDTSNQNEESIVKGQEEVTKVIKEYVDSNITEINKYAKDNSKVEFTIKELKDIFNIDVTKFDKLKYGCSQDNTFIKFDNEYQDYIIVLGCSAFYID